MALPGFFSHIKLGAETVIDPGDIIDVSDLSFAIVMHDDDDPVPHRYTTWGLEADSATLYQTLSDRNKIIVGNAGHVYALREESHTDSGVNIPMLWESGPLPEDSEEETITMQHRLHALTWQVKTPPPVDVGYTVAVSVIDMDDSANLTAKTVIQTETKVLVPITITARQFRIRLSVSVNQDFDIVSFGYSYQSLNRPYWRQ
jgi:hypothetical protein